MIEFIEYYVFNVGYGNFCIYYNVNLVNYNSNYGELFVMLKEYDIE